MRWCVTLPSSVTPLYMAGAKEEDEEPTVIGLLYQRTGPCTVTLGRQMHKELFFPPCPSDGRPFGLVVRALDSYWEPTEFRKSTKPDPCFSLGRSDDPTHRCEVVEVQVPRSTVMAAYAARELALEWAKAAKAFRAKLHETERLIRPLMERTEAGRIVELTDAEKSELRAREDEEMARQFERFARIHGCAVQEATDEQVDAFDWDHAEDSL